MEGAKLIRYNLPENSWHLFNRVFLSIPSSVNGVRLTLSARSILEKIFSLSKRKNDPDAVCRVTYKQLHDEYGFAKSTIARAFSQLKEAELIERKERDVDGTEYVYVGFPRGAKHYVVPAYFHTAELFVEGEWRKIKPSEVRVLSYLMTECAAPQSGGRCKTSHKSLARVLKLATSSVREALRALMNARLVYRPKRYKGQNGKYFSRYQVNRGLYLYQKYIAKRKMTADEAAVVRAQYYEELREDAQRRADFNVEIAERSPAFMDIKRRLGGIEPRIARATLFKPEDLSALQREKSWLLSRRGKILQSLGFDEDDLKPLPNCSICKDTGALPSGGGCSCYPGLYLRE